MIMGFIITPPPHKPHFYFISPQAKFLPYIRYDMIWCRAHSLIDASPAYAMHQVSIIIHYYILIFHTFSPWRCDGNKMTRRIPQALRHIRLEMMSRQATATSAVIYYFVQPLFLWAYFCADMRLPCHLLRELLDASFIICWEVLLAPFAWLWVGHTSCPHYGNIFPLSRKKHFRSTPPPPIFYHRLLASTPCKFLDKVAAIFNTNIHINFRYRLIDNFDSCDEWHIGFAQLCRWKCSLRYRLPCSPTCYYHALPASLFFHLRRLPGLSLSSLAIANELLIDSFIYMVYTCILFSLSPDIVFPHTLLCRQKEF